MSSDRMAGLQFFLFSTFLMSFSALRRRITGEGRVNVRPMFSPKNRNNKGCIDMEMEVRNYCGNHHNLLHDNIVLTCEMKRSVRACPDCTHFSYMVLDHKPRASAGEE